MRRKKSRGLRGLAGSAKHHKQFLETYRLEAVGAFSEAYTAAKSGQCALALDQFREAVYAEGKFMAHAHEAVDGRALSDAYFEGHDVSEVEDWARETEGALKNSCLVLKRGGMSGLRRRYRRGRR